MNIIFQIDGGLGKSIMATAIVKVIKKHYKNSHLIVVSGYPDIFLNNPHVNECFTIDQMGGAYLKYIQNKECKLFLSEPYHQNSYINKEKHLLETWCRLFDLEYENETPEIYLTKPEIEYFKPYYRLNKPILTIQPHGGPENQGFQYSWTRDLTSQVVDNIIERYKKDYKIIIIRKQHQIDYKNTLSALDGFRSIAILLQLSKKRLLIDSFGQHLAAALGLKSTVCWVTTKPEIFGYKLHDNILAEPFTKEPLLQNAVYHPFELSQDISSIPYNDLSEVFDINKIVTSLRNQ